MRPGHGNVDKSSGGEVTPPGLVGDGWRERHGIAGGRGLPDLRRGYGTFTGGDPHQPTRRPQSGTDSQVGAGLDGEGIADGDRAGDDAQWVGHGGLLLTTEGSLPSCRRG